ncbi:MAG: hypothetical protein ACR2N2_02210 [Acidimicrobiia bacterium]
MEGSRLKDELSGVRERLRSLPDHAFAERWALRNRQLELRDQIATLQASQWPASITPASTDPA